MRKVMNGEADFVNLAANEAYVAALNFTLSPLLQEQRSNRTDGIMYEAVAVVKKNAGITSLKDLKGKRSCHTGYGRNAGWSIPVSILHAGLTEPVCDELSAVATIFTQSCVPGVWSPDATMDKTMKMQHKNLCELCKNKCEDPNDPYLGYTGALQCLTETEAEIAFTKYVTAKEFFANHPNRNDYGYLCGNGTTVSLDDNCFWASRPNNFIVSNKAMGTEEANRLKETLIEIFNLFKPQNKPWMSQTIISNSSNITSLTPTMKPITDILNDFNFRITVDKPLPTSCMEKYVHFCVTSKTELDKCRDFKAASFAQRLRPQIECHLETSADDCLKAIRDGKADVMAADSGEVFHAYKDYGLIPIVSEVYGTLNGSYYAVAVVRSNTEIRSMEDLKGKKSCHTGFKRTAGWIVPAGTLKKKKLIEEDGCSLPNGVANFFSASCVPGITGIASLCKLCKGDGKGASVCEASANELYYGYSGAFRCLAENAGDVAFVKHTTVNEILSVPNPPEWARGLKLMDFSLLCPNGNLQPIENYAACSWANVASHKVVTSKTKSANEVMAIKQLLLRASLAFSPQKDLFKLFGKYGDGKDLLFKDSATGLQAVPADNDIRQTLGPDMYDDFQAAYCSTTDGASRMSFTAILAVCIAFVFLQQRMCLPIH